MRALKLYTLIFAVFLVSCNQQDCDTTTDETNASCESEVEDTQEVEEETEDGSSDETEDSSEDESENNGDESENNEDEDATPEETITESFYSPWDKSNTSIVIDAYQGNSIDWDEMAADTKVVGVIHRSSIGLRVDTSYETRKAIAKERGYLWGAYHLGYNGNVEAQAELFLDLVNDEEDTLMILDLENTTNGTFMTIDEAEEFMEIVYEETGRIPLVYANHSTTKMLNNQMAENPLFQSSKLWYARFKSSVTDFPVGIWKNYFLWQFSSEINCSSTGSCLYNVPGTRYDMDVNVYYGTKSELTLNWNND